MRAVQKLEAGETAVGILRWPQRAASDVRHMPGMTVPKRPMPAHLRPTIERGCLPEIAVMGARVISFGGQGLLSISFLL